MPFPQLRKIRASFGWHLPEFPAILLALNFGEKMTFNFQPVLRDETLLLRPLQADDRDALTKAASDPLIWAGHPAKTRHRPEVFAPYFDLLLKSEATLIALEAKTGAVLGCSRFYVAPDMPEAVSIGFTFLIRDCWGGDVNRQMKKLMLDHIFADRDEAWFHIDPGNFRSQKATEKLGARFVHEAELDLGTGAAPWRCYRLEKRDWQEVISRQP